VPAGVFTSQALIPSAMMMAMGMINFMFLVSFGARIDRVADDGRSSFAATQV